MSIDLIVAAFGGAFIGGAGAWLAAMFLVGPELEELHEFRRREFYRGVATEMIQEWENAGCPGLQNTGEGEP